MIISVGKSRKATEWRTEQVEWPALVQRLSTPLKCKDSVAEYHAMDREQQANAKDVGGFVGGLITGGSRKLANVSSRQLLCLDADYAEPTFWEDLEMIFPQACCLYSTHSHVPEAPRLRLIIPLSRAVSNTEYEAIGRKIAGTLGIEQFDDTTYQPNRLMFWPSVCKDGEFIFREQDGPWVDPDDVLSSYDNWRDASQWPVSKRVAGEMRSKARACGKPQEKPGLVGAFCRTYDVRGAIQQYLSDVFLPVTEDRYTYAGGTTIGGAVVFDDGDFLFSYHDHDPYHGRMLNAYDLVRLHLYGLQDADVLPDTPVQGLPSTSAMTELCASDAAVMSEYRLRNEEDFGHANHRYANELQDADVAQRIADHYTGKLMYNRSLEWLYWTGTHWKVDAKAACMAAIFEDLNVLLINAHEKLDTAMDKADKTEAAAYLKKVRSLRSSTKIFGIERLLREKLPLDNPDALDPDPWILNTPGGAVDLRTGEVQVSTPEMLCSHITRCTPEGGPAPRWQSFLEYATQGDAGLERYLQLVCGMAAVGKVYEEGLFIVYGPCGNGKSTMFGTIMSVLGDYATTIRSSVLIDKGFGEPYGLDAARGRRLVLMSELDEGAKMSVSTMKTLTSRDEIQVNPKYARTFSFRPTHKLILHTNHLPKLGQFDFGTQRRIAVVPFTAPAKQGKDRVPDLADELVRLEGPQILQWICEGARRFWEQGCRMGDRPDAVTAATDEYLTSEDKVAQFLADCCRADVNRDTPSNKLYEVYTRWCETAGVRTMSNRDLKKALESRGHVSRRKKNGVVWEGMRVVEDESQWSGLADGDEDI